MTSAGFVRWPHDLDRTITVAVPAQLNRVSIGATAKEMIPA